MKNGKTKLFGIITIVGGAIVSLLLMYLCTSVVGLGGLVDDTEFRVVLLLPIIMTIVTVVSYLIWFSSKANKFTSGQYPTLENKYYGSLVVFILTSFIQYIVAFVATIPLFGFLFFEVSIPMLLPIAITEIIFLIVNGICFWVWRPVGNMQM